MLVVEGWLPDYALAQARDEFEHKGYELAVTTGGPLRQGSLLSDHSSYADLAAATLRRMGLDEARAAPAGSVRRNRTYEAAMGLKAWLVENAPGVSSMNVVSLGIHARRSRMMYQRALGDGYRIGIIAVPDREYEATNWWHYSAGLKGVLTEGLAYVHAKLLFDPDLESGPVTPVH
jgi:hypothetical protein